MIVIATHNPRPRLLERQLASIRAQTVEDFECLVLDDASTNRDYVSYQCDLDDRFTLLPTQPHLGHYAAFETLLTSSNRGPTFLCDQDDVWRSDKIERILCAMEDGRSAAFSAMRVVDEAGDIVRDRFLPHAPRSLRPADLLLMNCVSGAALCVSPSTVRASLPFPGTGLRGWHDQWLAAVAARIGELVYLDEPLVDYTQHQSQVIGDGLRKVTWRRLQNYAGRTGSPRGLAADIRSRTRWITAAAGRLLDLSDRPDPDLVSLARGRWSEHLAGQLWDGLRRGEVPAARAALLAAGYTLR
jgi:glycosyltransferase involved in cell wall biosynthesis